MPADKNIVPSVLFTTASEELEEEVANTLLKVEDKTSLFSILFVIPSVC